MYHVLILLFGLVVGLVVTYSLVGRETKETKEQKKREYLHAYMKRIQGQEVLRQNALNCSRLVEPFLGEVYPLFVEEIKSFDFEAWYVDIFAEIVDYRTAKKVAADPKLDFILDYNALMYVYMKSQQAHDHLITKAKARLNSTLN